jgi:chromosome segregation ATPase
LLREKGPALSLDNDLIQQAKLNHPGYDGLPALTLDILAKAKQQQKTDAAQNNLINTQQNAIKSIGQELQDYEAQAQETDREVERLKQLSGMLTTGSSNTQQKAKVSADELEKLQKDLEALKTKPGMDPEKYKDIEQQITALANSSGAEDNDVKGLQNLVSKIQNKAKVNFDDVAAQLAKTKKDLDSKEVRFKKYVKDTGEYKTTTTKELKTSAEEIQKYSNIVNNAKKKLDGFDEFMNNEKTNILSIRGEIQDMANELASKTDEVNDLVDIARAALKNPNAAAVAQNAIGQAQQSSQAAGQPAQPPRARPLPSFIDNEENKQTTNEEAKMPIRPAFNYASDPDLGMWMQKTLPYLVDQFKKKYNLDLKRKNPTYTDHQIAYAIEDNIDVLLKQDTDKIPRDEVLNKFLTWVKHELFRIPPESILHLKQDDLFAESLDRTYARMLDKLIGLPYIKG